MQTHPSSDAQRDADAERPVVTACESCPGRTVLIESDNADGWIASELVVSAREYR